MYTHRRNLPLSLYMHSRALHPHTQGHTRTGSVVEAVSGRGGGAVSQRPERTVSGCASTRMLSYTHAHTRARAHTGTVAEVEVIRRTGNRETLRITRFAGGAGAGPRPGQGPDPGRPVGWEASAESVSSSLDSFTRSGTGTGPGPQPAGLGLTFFRPGSGDGSAAGVVVKRIKPAGPAARHGGVRVCRPKPHTPPCMPLPLLSRCIASPSPLSPSSPFLSRYRVCVCPLGGGAYPAAGAFGHAWVCRFS